MKASNTLLALLFISISLPSCNKEKIQTASRQTVIVDPELRPLLYDVGSKWVYQDISGHRDSAIIIGIDSNVTSFNSTDNNFVDMQVIEVNYSPNEVIGDKQVFRSNFITSNYKHWSPAWGNLMYMSKRISGLSTEPCLLDECISLIEVLDKFEVNEKVYTHVSHFITSTGHEFWWDSSIGIVKYKSENEDWELFRTHLIP